MKNASTGKTTPKTNPVSHTDWPRVRAMRNDEIRHDADSPETQVADWEGATLKQAGVEVGRAKTRGPNRRPTKEQVAVRYSADVLAAFRATGRGWQTRMDEALRDWLKEHSQV
jgi:uncharacterized protein (DUF4415 family)